MSNTISNFIYNNVKSIFSPWGNIKDLLRYNSFAFLHETYSSKPDERKWKNDFKDRLFFSHGSTSFCGVLEIFYGSKSLQIIDRKSDKKSGILIPDTKLNDKKFLLGHLYYSNTQSERN